MMLMLLLYARCKITILYIENEKNNNMKRTQLQHTKYIDINTKRKHIYSNVSIVLLN